MADLVFTELAGAPVALVPIASSDQRAIVDAEQAPLVAGRPWRVCDGYARTTVQNGSTLLMHALILPVDPPLTVDHANGNRLDNRASNLRAATRAQQQWNRGKQRNNRSGFKGVSFHTLRRRWRATIRVDGRHVHLGLFDDPELAARAYDAAAVDAWGDFARVNFAEATR